jgi:tetratricopeptide (TPR) repeat protein
MSAAETDQPPDPGTARDLDELVDCLRALKVWAGDPSYDTITRRVNARWSAAGRPANEHARRGTVVDCFRSGRRRLNTDLLIAVVRALHDETGYVTHWRQAMRVTLAETRAGSQVRVFDRLPDDTAAFTGRDAQLSVLRQASGGVFVLTGMAGVGKTQLAVHAGHLRDGFDSKLFVNLRGFHPDSSQPPASPSAVLDGFLRLLGVPAAAIPHTLGGRASAFESRLSNLRALVILDNAADEDQVRPLLVNAPGVLTMVTSRRELNGLNGVVRLSVDVLSPPEAIRLLSEAVPSVPLGADPSAYGRVARRCGFLPLALTVVGGQMGAAPGWTVTDHADRLDERHQHHRLDSGVELALHSSYQSLPSSRQILLRRLASHPGQDLDDQAAAALLSADLSETREQLTQLTADHLVEHPVPGRFSLHDLVRSYAAERSVEEDRQQDRREALTRLFDHYLYGAATAMDLLYPAEKHRRPSLDFVGPFPGPPSAKAALMWLDAERATLVAVCLHAARNDWPTLAIRLAATLYSYLDNGGYPADAVTVHTEARHAAQSLGDRGAEAGALISLGVVHWQMGNYPAAIDELTQSLELFRAVGDVRGEARALGNLGVAYTKTGQLELSIGFHDQALSRFVAIGDHVGEANTLTNIGDAYVRSGRVAPAADHHSRALLIFRAQGHRGGEATALTNLGDVHVRLGRHPEAVREHEEALAIFGELGERYGQTCALNGLGEALTGLGRHATAIERHRAALELAISIDEPGEQERAREALDRLAAIGDAG